VIDTLDAIKHAPLNQRTYLQLRAFVLSGAVPMGRRLDENALAKQLGVSRTPVREAIGKLVQEGLVEYRPFQGNFVRLITVEQVRELFEVRKSLEGLAARLAVGRMTDDGLEAITEILDEVHAALEAGDMDQYAVADSRFHKAIATISGNSTLIEILDQLSAQIQLARVLANRDQTVVQRTAHERPLILEALRNRNADAAGRLLEEHIQGVFDALSHTLPDESTAGSEVPED
jgi:DNA-binding GntR family transcriptional regulator